RERRGEEPLTTGQRRVQAALEEGDGRVVAAGPQAHQGEQDLMPYAKDRTADALRDGALEQVLGGCRVPGEAGELRPQGVRRLRQDQVGPRPLVRLGGLDEDRHRPDRKSTRLNSSHVKISYAVFCLKK